MAEDPTTVASEWRVSVRPNFYGNGGGGASDSSRWFNKRAEAFWHFRTVLEHGRIQLEGVYKPYARENARDGATIEVGDHLTCYASMS